MRTETETHLNREQILSAVVDGADLAPALRDHLAACPRCHLGKSSIEQELELLGRTAERYVPVPKKRMTVPQETSRNRIIRLGRRRVGPIAVAATALLLVFIAWGSGRMGGLQENTGPNLVLDNQEAETLIGEVNMLMEEAIPQVYLRICAESELEFNDEFIQYIVPVVDENPMSLIPKEKGVELC